MPMCLSLKNVKGCVATNKGIVKVEWWITPEGFKIKGHVPEGIPFEVVLPGGRIVEYHNGGAFKLL